MGADPVRGISHELWACLCSLPWDRHSAERAADCRMFKPARLRSDVQRNIVTSNGEFRLLTTTDVEGRQLRYQPVRDGSQLLNHLASQKVSAGDVVPVCYQKPTVTRLEEAARP